jgi:hypothetical protein
MTDGQEEIKNIVAQLQRLQIQESELLQRLDRAIETESRASGAPREFQIGDLVQIKNPKPFQARQGTIVKIGIGTNRITVQARNGSKVVRASFNLRHID